MSLALLCSPHHHANVATTTLRTEFQETIQLLPELSMSYVMNVRNRVIGQGTLKMEAVLHNVGWIGIGFSQNGLMANSTAIVALPNEPVSGKNPAKYHIANSYEGGMTRDDDSSLIDGDIQQNETTTVLSFTIPLLRQREIPIRYNATNHVIFAYGYRNDLSYHADRDSITIDFVPCVLATTMQRKKTWHSKSRQAALLMERGSHTNKCSHTNSKSKLER